MSAPACRRLDGDMIEEVFKSFSDKAYNKAVPAFLSLPRTFLSEVTHSSLSIKESDWKKLGKIQSQSSNDLE